MSYTSQDQLEGFVLKALYDFVQNDSGFQAAQEVSALFDGEYSVDRVTMALKALDKAGFVQSRHSGYSGSSYSISEHGYRQVEQALHNDVDLTETAPAADRIVSYDHNSREFQEVIESVEAFKTQLAETNDTGNLSVDEVATAVHEVGQIRETLDQPFLRPTGLWLRASSLLRWIGVKAAEAAVGTAALALLALIGAYFGFAI